MKRLHAFLVLLAVTMSPALADSMSDARDILDRYTRAERPAGPARGAPYDRVTGELARGASMKRVTILAEWKAMPAEAIAVAGPFLFDKASPEQRYEIVTAFRDIRTRECAELLHRVLQDARQPEEKGATPYEELTRCEAVAILGEMARTVAPGARKRLQRGPASAPQVPGLAPYLVSAAGDKSERVRIYALGALADSGDPDAAAELKRRLEDKSDTVRFQAACLLTEFQDASGMRQLRDRLGKLLKTDPIANSRYYSDAAMLFISFERCAGKSLGETPMDPSISNSTSRAATLAQDYQDLLKAWDAFWKTENIAR